VTYRITGYKYVRRSSLVMLLQPTGQKRHTNIQIVSYSGKSIAPQIASTTQFESKTDKKSHKLTSPQNSSKNFHFELACYKNKVQDYRNGNEQDLSNILQSDEIFSDVSTGDLATKKDIQECFGPGMTKPEIIKFMLSHGQGNLNEKEREHELEALKKEVLNNIGNTIMDIEGRAVPITVLERVLDELKFVTKPCPARKRSQEHSKLLAREGVKLLEKSGKFFRLNTKVKVIRSADTSEMDEFIENETAGIDILGKSDLFYVLLVHPSEVKTLKEKFGEETVEIVDGKVNIPLSKSLKEVKERTAAEAEKAESIAAVAAAETAAAASLAKEAEKKHPNACTCCPDASFPNLPDLRVHFKSEWHLYNKKLQVKQQPAIDHLEFELIPVSVRNKFLAVDNY
jgi:ribosome maturation protein SDO1